MTSDNSSEEKANKSFWNTTIGTITKITALLTAVTGLVLAVKPYFKTDNTSNVSEGTHPVSDSQHPTLPPPIDYYGIATDMANQWCNDLKNKNLDGLVSGSSVPFYADNKILNSLSEVRGSYQVITDKFTPREISDSMHDNVSTVPVLSELKIYKASELKSKGFDITHDRLFNSLNLEDDPYVGSLGFRSNSGKVDYVELVFRKTGNTLKIAGWWD